MVFTYPKIPNILVFGNPLLMLRSQYIINAEGVSQMKRTFKISASISLVCVLLTSCADPNQHALDIGAPPIVDGKTISSVRSIQSRSFETLNRESLVQASTATLQDLGFTVGEVSKDFGVLTGSKERDAVESGQIAVQTVLVILSALGGSAHTPRYDETQKISITVLISEIDEKSSQVRVFFDRHITNNLGELWKADLITDAEIYQQFFEKMSQSTFLEENKS